MIARIAIVVVGLGIALFVAVFVWLRTASFDQVVQEYALPAISERLGRDVTTRSIEGRGFFRAAVEIEDLQIAGTGPEPFATVRSIYIHIRPWRFVFSGGRTVEASTVEVRGFHVNLVRLPNGKWNVPIPPKRPPSKELVRADTVRLIDGGMTVLDEEKGMRLEVTDIEGLGTDEDPFFKLEDLTARTLGGTLRFDGAFDRMDPSKPKWRGDAYVQGVDLGKLHSLSKPIEGTIAARAHIAGQGMGAEARRSAEGTAHIELRDATWIHFTVGEEILRELGKVIHSHKLEANPPGSKAHTSLGEPTADLRIHGGWATLEEPVHFQTSMGRMDLTGRVGLDQRLDLAGVVIVAPEFLTDLVGGKVHINDPLPVRFRIVGTASQPKVTGIDVEPFGESLPGLLKRLENKILAPFQKKQ